MTSALVDVCIIGGGPAGLSAALYTARAIRSTVVIDSQVYRNKDVEHAHSFLTQDNAPPSTIRDIGAEQLKVYPNVSILNDEVTDAKTLSGDLAKSALAENGVKQENEEHPLPNDVVLIKLKTRSQPLLCRVLIIATGVRDTLPPLKGLQEIWPHTAANCPFCHGVEFKDKPTAVYTKGNPMALFYSLKVLLWTKDVTVVTDGSELTESELQLLAHNRVKVVNHRVDHLEHSGKNVSAIVFEDGSKIDVCR